VGIGRRLARKARTQTVQWPGGGIRGLWWVGRDRDGGRVSPYQRRRGRGGGEGVEGRCGDKKKKEGGRGKREEDNEKDPGELTDTCHALEGVENVRYGESLLKRLLAQLSKIWIEKRGGPLWSMKKEYLFGVKGMVIKVNHGGGELCAEDLIR